jgi:hypothetical protein
VPPSNSHPRNVRPSNSGTRRGRVVGALIVGFVVIALAATIYIHNRVHDPIVLGYWWIGNLALLFCMYAFIKGRRFLHLRPAPGRVVAIVPAYEENPDDLYACIWSILNQEGALVDEVHVVDDGSVEQPVVPFHHPRVIWHHKPNGGKRAAQVHVLSRLNPTDWDFVLTVDGDSVLDQHAMAHLLRAFSKPTVMATTGMVLVRNASHNLLTRIADVNIGTSCVMMRASRSLLGTLETTSGALAVYRAHILFKHKLRYLAAGTYGDDRCLAMYSALEGEVVGVNEAVVWSEMPSDLKTTYRQRLRWSKSWWCMIPFVLTNMRRPGQMFFPLFGLMQLAIAPLTIGYTAIAVTMAAVHGTVAWWGITLYAAVYLLVRYAEVGLYMVERPATPWTTKLWTWLLLTPIEAGYNLLFLNPPSTSRSPNSATTAGAPAATRTPPPHPPPRSWPPPAFPHNEASDTAQTTCHPPRHWPKVSTDGPPRQPANISPTTTTPGPSAPRCTTHAPSQHEPAQRHDQHPRDCRLGESGCTDDAGRQLPRSTKPWAPPPPNTAAQPTCTRIKSTTPNSVRVGTRHPGVDPQLDRQAVTGSYHVKAA